MLISKIIIIVSLQLKKYSNINYKHWDSAYLRQGTSYQCRHLANHYEQQIYVRYTLSVSSNSDESGKQSLYPDGDPDCYRNLIICSVSHCQPFRLPVLNKQR